jgi:hypothetical protein
MRINLRQLFIGILFIALFFMTLRPIADPDFWWHLRTGQLIAETHSIPHSDPFSSTNPGVPWVAHEWLTELLFYFLFRVGNFGLLIIVFSVIISAAFLLVYLRCPDHSRPYVAGLVLLLGALSTAPTWGVRPQMISLLLTSLFLFLLDRYSQKGQLRYILLIPLITLVWVNLHAGYFLGLVVVGVYLGGEVIDLLRVTLLKHEIPEHLPLRSLIALSAILVASVLAAVVNPNGFHILIYPFQTLVSPSMMQLIQEWFSPDFHLILWQPFALFLLMLIGAGMIGKKTISTPKILLTLLLGYASLRSMRNIPLFILVAVPVLAEEVDSFLRIRQQPASVNRLFKWVIPILLTFFLLLTGARFVQVAGQQQETEAKYFPSAAVDWIVENKPQGQLYNTYGWGGYLIWRLYPEYPVYIDGRADVYGDTFIFDFMSIQRAEPGWEEKLQDRSIQILLIEPDTTLAKLVRLSSSWENVFEDDQSILFVQTK